MSKPLTIEVTSSSEDEGGGNPFDNQQAGPPGGLRHSLFMLQKEKQMSDKNKARQAKVNDVSRKSMASSYIADVIAKGKRISDLKKRRDEEEETQNRVSLASDYVSGVIEKARKSVLKNRKTAKPKK